MRLFRFFLCTGVLLLLPLSVLGQEQITDFLSDVTVLASGELVVEETISVVSEGKDIQRGIYRDFPTSYTDEKGRSYTVSFAVTDVERDGHPEPYHIRKIVNGVRVYMGDKNVLIPRGHHTYTLHYITDQQLGFFSDHDELYWNVTGNGWNFTILHAKLSLAIPPAGSIEEYSFFTGPAGSQKKDARVLERRQNQIFLETTRPLPPASGFTVVAAWPKGVVKEPGMIQQGKMILQKYFLSGASFIGLLFLVVYYFLSWLKVGKDPSAGTIIPQFDPPENISPAAGRFILHMGFDQKSLAATLVSMAVKGVVKIIIFEDVYTVRLIPDKDNVLSPGESVVRQHFFSGGESLVLNKENQAVIRSAVNALEKQLRKDMLNVYFLENRSHLIPGLLISFVILAAVIMGSPERGAAAMMIFWLLIWLTGTVKLMFTMIAAWQNVLANGVKAGKFKRALATTFAALPFLAGALVGVYMLYKSVSTAGQFIILAVLAVNLTFAWLLKSPTPAGRRIMDHLEGLRLYLSVAEKDRLNILNPPEKTPELFERLFPWALALDVEQLWCDQFARQFDQFSEDSKGYKPAWYSSSHTFSSHGFSSSMGANFASSIASSSVAPGSSSGLSSGGSSGGGGGGGGW